MLLLFLIRIAELPPVTGKRCSFGLLCVSSLGVCQFVSMHLSLLLCGRVWDLIVLVPDYCLSFTYCDLSARN